MKISDLIPSIERFLQAWRIVRICPDKITAPKEQLSFNVLTLAIALVIFVIARTTVAGAESGVEAHIAATVISAFIVFCTGFVTLIFDSSEQGLEKARKWGTFFVLVWLTSLIAVFVIDGVLLKLRMTPLSTRLIDYLFVPGSLHPIMKDALRALLFGIVALGILLLKTKRMDQQFTIRSPCALTTVAIGLLMNTILLVIFLYGSVI